MADRNQKDSTPPPLLLMPNSQGLTLEPVGGNALFMPLAQTEASLFAPEEEGEADSFVGQTPPSHSSMSTYFQPSQQQSVPTDPFAQISQPMFDGTPSKSAAPSSFHNTLVSSYSSPASFIGTPQRASGPSSFRISGPPRYAPPPTGIYAPDTFLGSSPMHPATSSNMAPPQTSSRNNMLPPLGGAGPAMSGPPSVAPPIGGFQPRAQAPAAGHPVHLGMNPGGHYIPVQKHWFYCKNIELRKIWKPFSMADSLKLEDAFRSGHQDNVIMSTEGGRYDVDVIERKRTAVYWQEVESEVRRCSWFYRLEGDNRYVPYDENFAERLEAEYKNALVNNDWHKRLEFPEGETIVMHSPAVLLHFRAASQPDEYGTTQSDQRPRVVKRGVDDFDSIVEGEPSKVDHLVFVVHGIGPTCDLRFRNIVECVDDFRVISMQMMDAHFKPYQEEGRIGRVEYLPVCWHSALHSDATGVDRKLKNITLKSIGKLRHFTNDTLLDILFYTSPVYCQNIADTVGTEINRLHTVFLGRNPDFGGKVSLAGHSLGSLILFDLLAHQKSDQVADVDSSSSMVNGSSEVLQAVQDLQVAQDEVQEEDEDIPVIVSMEEAFQQLGLQDYIETFHKEKIDMETLIMCEDSDLKEMGLPLGPRKKLQGFLKEHKQNQAKRKAAEKRKSEQEIEKKAREQAQKYLEEQAQQNQQKLESTINRDPLMRESSQTDVRFVVGVGGTGLPLVKYPQLDFNPSNFFALGSPISMFLTVRGVSVLGEEYRFPTCPGFFNIFHPFDPVAYRLEPLVTNSFPPKPVLMPHHKGRKRLHLELRDGLSRVGADLKQKIVDSLKSTWKTINDFALAHRTTAQEIDKQVENVVNEMTQEEDDALETASMTSSVMEDEIPIGQLNHGRRIDFVLQERPIESFNDYLFALSSHACYWESEDTVLMILKEIYSLEGVAPIKAGQIQPPTPQLYRPPLSPMFPGASSPLGGLPHPGVIPQTSPMLPPPSDIPTVNMSPIPSSTPQRGPPASNIAPPPMAGFVKSPGKMS